MYRATDPTLGVFSDGVGVGANSQIAQESVSFIQNTPSAIVDLDPRAPYLDATFAGSAATISDVAVDRDFGWVTAGLGLFNSALVVDRNFAVTIVGLASSSSGIDTSRELAAAFDGLGTLVSAISAEREFAGTASGAASVVSQVSVIVPIVVTLSGAATVSTTLALDRALAMLFAGAASSTCDRLVLDQALALSVHGVGQFSTRLSHPQLQLVGSLNKSIHLRATDSLDRRNLAGSLQKQINLVGSIND